MMYDDDWLDGSDDNLSGSDDSDTLSSDGSVFDGTYSDISFDEMQEFMDDDLSHSSDLAIVFYAPPVQK